MTVTSASKVNAARRSQAAAVVLAVLVAPAVLANVSAQRKRDEEPALVLD